MGEPHTASSSRARDPSGAIALVVVDAPEPFALRWQAACARGAERGELVRLAFAYHHAMVLATARLMLDDREDAEDALQSVFERFARKLDSVREPERIPGFLKTTVTRHCLGVLGRRRWWRGRRGIVLAQQLADRSLDASDATMVVAASDLLRRLPAAERVAVVLRFVEQLSLAEVAEAMQSSVSTVQRRLACARERLAALELADDDPRASLLRELPDAEVQR